MEISPRLEDAIVEFLQTKTAQSRKLMEQVEEEMANRRKMLERLEGMLASRDAEVVGPFTSRDELDDLLFGDDDDEDPGH